MYERFETLLRENGITAYKLAKDTGISTATLTSWKQGAYTPKNDKLQRIAAYFGVTLDWLTGVSDVRIPAAPVKNEKLAMKAEVDIAKSLQKTLDRLNTENGLMFDGVPLDNESRELLIASIENSVRAAKIIAKSKYAKRRTRK